MSRNQGFFTLLYLILSFIGLWFYSNYLLPRDYFIAGHDSGLSLDSKAFLETRLYAWDERVNFGWDNSLLFGSLTIHGFDFLFSLLSGISYAGNHLNLFFWISLIFISALFFAYQLKSRLGSVFVFIFPVLILFNFYVFQSIFILERAKYSLISASLIFLAFIVRLLDEQNPHKGKKISLIATSALSALVFTIFNGGSWLALPLFGGLLIIIIVLLLFLLIQDFKLKNFSISMRFLSFLFLTGIFFLIANSYSLIPYIQTFFVSQDYQSVQRDLTIQANKAWLDYISQGSSFLNIFRLQGVPDWYENKYAAASMHPFAKFYLENKLMLSLSYLIPITAIGSLVLVTNNMQKRIIGLFATISLVSMVFMAGTRSPLGFLYEFLFEYIPGFAIFRSSFYKFGYAFIITYSALISFTLTQIINLVVLRMRSSLLRTLMAPILVVIILALWLGYHYKLFDGSIFNWRTNFSTRIKAPNYINEYKEYVSGENLSSGRVLILPPLNESWLSDSYVWGYWSLSTIHYSMTKQVILANSQALNKGESKWVDVLYKIIRSGDEAEILNMARRLNVTGFLLKKDSLPESVWSSGEDPRIYEEILGKIASIQKKKTLGNWVVYEIKQPKPPLIFVEDSLIELTQNDIEKIKPFLGERRTFIRGEDDKINDLDKFSVKKIIHYECRSCVIEDPAIVYQFSWPRILPNSLLFPLKIFNEDYRLSKITDEKKRLTDYYGLIGKRTAETEAMLYYKMPDLKIIENLKSIDFYLDEVSRITKKNYNPEEDFTSARLLLDNIYSVEIKLVSQLSSDKAGLRGEGVRDQIAKTVYKIYELKKFYSPILEKSDKWEKEKTYEIEIPEGKKSLLYMDESSFPVDNQGKYILPQITVNKEQIKYSNPARVKNWLEIASDKLAVGKNELTLKFEIPPNIFVIEGNYVVETPEGRKMCYEGKINAPISRKSYVLRIKTDDQPLRVFSKTKTSDKLTAFLGWRNEIKVEGIYDDDYFRYIYYPPIAVDKLNIYICSEHQSLPRFKEFIIEEAFQPELIGVEEFDKKFNELPEISYQRIDPTRYTVEVRGAAGPFILVMNQRFSPLWKLTDLKNNTEIDAKNFPIDLYANGWLIDQKGDLSMMVEYRPQKYFKIGEVISVVFILFLIGLSGYGLWRR